ncbi:hypothetical protein [Bradyrhizobium genosp. SA-3]|uniref:hypothetical protein n=1 Tax=Bradyrhizobium genosp. SA-3 TaxID=508868 RepID=UPI001029ADB7|nr:hypothetical protein [Bradyrhizobium genosp. SA-3]
MKSIATVGIFVGLFLWATSANALCNRKNSSGTCISASLAHGYNEDCTKECYIGVNGKPVIGKPIVKTPKRSAQ